MRSAQEKRKGREAGKKRFVEKEQNGEMEMYISSEVMEERSEVGAEGKKDYHV